MTSRGPTIHNNTGGHVSHEAPRRRRQISSKSNWEVKRSARTNCKPKLQPCLRPTTALRLYQRHKHHHRLRGAKYSRRTYFGLVGATGYPASSPWVAVEELKLSHHNPETLLFPICSYYGNLFLNSLTATQLKVARNTNIPSEAPPLVRGPPTVGRRFLSRLTAACHIHSGISETSQGLDDVVW